MFFSVIIPTYKRNNTMLKRAIDSVFLQDEKDFEIIVVDDNPKDSKWKKDSYVFSQKNAFKNVKFIFHPDNRGANAARNTGVRNAEGEIIAFLDSDDEWDKSYLKEVRKAFSDDTIGISASYVKQVFANRSIEITQACNDGNVYKELIFKDVVGPTSAVAIRKKTLYESGLFDEHMPARQDYDTWLRVCKNNNIKYIRKPLVIMHCDDHERISNTSLNHVYGTLRVLEKLVSNPDLEQYKVDLKYTHYKYLGLWGIRCNRYDIARKYLKKSLKYKKSYAVVLYLILCYCPFLLSFILKIYRLRYKVKSINWLPRLGS